MARRGETQAGGTSGKGSRAGSGGAADSGKTGRIKQIRLVFGLTRKKDPRLVLWTAVAFLIPVVIGVLLGLFLKPLWLWIPFGVIFGVLLALNVFGRRAQKSAFTEMEGQPGAGISVVQRMRGDWRGDTPPPAKSKQRHVVT